MSPSNPGPMTTPSASELIDFNTFASAMTSAPLDELHKYMDSDDEQDLEDNYADDADSDLYAEEENHTAAATSFNFDTYPATDDEDSFSESDNDNDHETHDFFDARFDLDRSRLRPSHAASRHLDSDLQRTIDETELLLEGLSLRAQGMVEEQPMSTQIVLANLAAETVFRPYGVHGSMARYSEAVMGFLGGGDVVRGGGTNGRGGRRRDGRLRFAGVDVVEGGGRDEKRRADGKVGGDMEGVRMSKVRRTGEGLGPVAMTRPRLEIDTQPSKVVFDDMNLFGDRVGYGFQPASRVPLNGPQGTADALSYRKTSGPLDLLNADNDEMDTDSDTAQQMMVPQPPTNCLSKTEPFNMDARPPQLPTITDQGFPTSPASMGFTPLASAFSQSLYLQTPSPYKSTFSSQSSQRPTLPVSPHPSSMYSCTYDAEANTSLAHEAYNPITLSLSWPATTRADGRPCMPTPGLLDALNDIIHLSNAEGRFLLSYYVRKYDAPTCIDHESSAAPTRNAREERVEPPHALFRLGISQYLMSKVGKVIDHKDSDELGLNPEARRLLGNVWEAHPSVQLMFDDDLDSGHNEDSGEDDDKDMQDGIEGAEGDSDRVMSDADTDVVSESTASMPLQGTRRLNYKKTPFRGGLNPLEKVLLARACNISVQTVEAYWDDMRDKTKAWAAMKLWCEAQTKVKIARAKVEKRW